MQERGYFLPKWTLNWRKPIFICIGAWSALLSHPFGNGKVGQFHLVTWPVDALKIIKNVFILVRPGIKKLIRLPTFFHLHLLLTGPFFK